jgi:hypothetical protein
MLCIMNVQLRIPKRSRRVLRFFMIAATGWAVLVSEVAPAAGPATNSPQVEIKKLSTGKEATITQGEKEWFIHIDVDDNRTMIIRTESTKGQETKNSPEIVDRPMSNAEVDRVINDWISGVKSTLQP